MKNLVAILLFVAVSTVLRASSPLSYSVSNKWIIIDNEKWKSPSIDVTLRSIHGNTIFNEKISRITKYNLKNVVEGEYTLVLEDNQKINSQKVTIEKGKLILTDESTIYKPHFIIHDMQIVDLNLMSQGAEVNIVIRDASGKDVFNETYKNQVSIEKRFNLSELPKGDYLIEVSHHGETFSQKVVR